MASKQGTILANGKKKRVKTARLEILLFLRSYSAHPCSWTDILDTMKGNMSQLPDAVKELYNSASRKQLRDRLSAQLNRLLSKPSNKIEDEEIRAAVEDVKATELRYASKPQNTSQQPKSRKRKAQGHTPASLATPAVSITPAPTQSTSNGHSNDADLEEYDEEEDEDVALDNDNNENYDDNIDEDDDVREAIVAALPDDPEPKEKKKKKSKSSMEMFRQNQILYNKFMTKKVPKVLQVLGISDSDTD